MIDTNHGAILCAFLKELEERNDAVLSDGAISVVDSVELARFLRALVEHRPTHTPKRDLVKVRADRMTRAFRGGPAVAVVFLGPDRGWSNDPDAEDSIPPAYLERADR